MYVPKTFIGSAETFISRGLVLFFNEPIHKALVFFLFSFKPEILPNFPNTDILSRKDEVSNVYLCQYLNALFVTWPPNYPINEIIYAN